MKPPKNNEFDQLMRGVQPLHPDEQEAPQNTALPELELPGGPRHAPATQPKKFAGFTPAPGHRRAPLINKHFHPERVIDLHGMTLAQAREAATHALQRAKTDRLLTLLLITGKGLSSPGGKSVIRQEMQDWLFHRQDAAIQQVRFAPKHLGGEGAILVIFA